MANGIIITKPGHPVQTASVKDRVLDTDNPILKLLQIWKRSFTLNAGQSQTYEEDIKSLMTGNSISLPFLPLVYLYVPSLTAYKLVGPTKPANYFSEYLFASMEFTSTKLYVSIINNTGGQVSSHYYFYIGYA